MALPFSLKHCIPFFKELGFHDAFGKTPLKMVLAGEGHQGEISPVSFKSFASLAVYHSVPMSTPAANIGQIFRNVYI